jgi:hypothetical protein
LKRHGGNWGARAAASGLVVAVTLSVCSPVTAQSVPTTSAGPPTDTQIRSELWRLNATKTDCLVQAHQALTLQRSSNARGRLADADAYGQTLRDKMACVDKANQDLVRLQIEAGPEKTALFLSEDRFHQEYRQALHAQLGSLQHIGEQLADPDAIRYEIFAQQVDALRRQTDVVKNRYIRLLKDSETQALAQAVFQATDLLIASARAWKEQVRAEAGISELTAKGPGTLLAQAQSQREAALKQRVAQWAAAQRLISQAAALAATR